MRRATWRILYVRPVRPPNRCIAHLSIARPKVPVAHSRFTVRQTRPVTTDGKSDSWRPRAIFALKTFAVSVVTTGLFATLAFGIHSETLERKYPSPREWSFMSRHRYREAMSRVDPEYGPPQGDPFQWSRAAESFLELLQRLEDPAKDGKGLQEQAEGGILVEGVGKTGYDISHKPEPWRRGYYEALMGMADAAEHLESWVRDTTRESKVFPSEMVVGPSNPNPRPVLRGMPEAPLEQNCVRAFDPPDKYYMRILTTLGFTEKQRIGAALAYATYLDFKDTPEAALEMYKWAMDIAVGPISGSKLPIDPATGIISTDTELVSENILQVSTAIGLHHAHHKNLSTALPIFVSILRARRAIPNPPDTMLASLKSSSKESTGKLPSSGFRTILRSILVPPEYPPPPTDGTSPPTRDAAQNCSEATVMAYIGEILYASSNGLAGREDGLAWTREGVDVAETELRKDTPLSKEDGSTCKQCLRMALDNWAAMVKQLAVEERESKETQSAAAKLGGWLGLSQQQPDAVGRWESEERVVLERKARVQDVLNGFNVRMPKKPEEQEGAAVLAK